MTGMDFGRYVFGPPYLGWLVRGVVMTLVISILSGVGAGALGLAVQRCRMSRSAPLRTAAFAFVVFFRNLPLVPLLLVLTFGLPGIWRELGGHSFPRGFEFILLVLGLALNTSGYVAEILRAGVESVAHQQLDAARALGLPARIIRRRVVYPQAIRVVAPALASRFIHNMKNSTLSLIVPLPLQMMEVLGQASRIAGETFSWAEPVLFAAAVHLFLAFGLGALLNASAIRKPARIGG